nr:hypothetical protein [Pseudonocardia sediminis]
MRGRAPSFFEGDPEAFSGLRFNVETEAFQFYAPMKMKDDPLWIDVTKLYAGGFSASFGQLRDLTWAADRLDLYVDRLQQLRNIGDREFHIEQITGADKTVDVVVDIFNRVNSGGTKLSKGDLALARICSEWGDARPTMRRNLDRWAERDLSFTPDWLLRNVNAVATGRAPFSALEDVSASDFEDALYKTLHNIDYVLGLLSGRLGLDHDRVLMGRYAVPVLSRLMHRTGGRFADNAETDRALYWYVHAALRGRFAGSTETFLAKDLETVEASGIDGVIASLSRTRKNNMSIDAEDFEGVGKGSRSYPLLYMITRVRDGRDLLTGRSLGHESASVEVHEIFPKAALAKHGYTRAEVNAIANFAFVSPSSAVGLSGADPAAYLTGLQPQVLTSQWIPQDPRLWEIENYREFLTARRELLAAATGEFLDDLLAGRHPWDRELQVVQVSEEPAESDVRVAQISALVEEFAELGFSSAARDAEIADPETGRVLAVAELFWSDGLQAGQGKPVVLELDPDEADLPRLMELGYEVFSSVDTLRGFVQRRSAVVSGDEEDQGVGAPVEPVVDIPEVEDGAFDRVMFGVIETCRTELGYNPQYLREMVLQHGAVGATRRLLASPTVSDGFVRLWDAGRLDLTVEALVVDPRFVSLFGDRERAVAQDRLDRSRQGVDRTA